MKLLSALLILISISTSGAEYNPNLVICPKPKINLSKMNEVLEALKENNAISKISSIATASSVPENAVTLKVRELSKKIQKEVFGREVLKVHFVADESVFTNIVTGNATQLVIGVGIATHILQNKLYIDGESLLAFMWAHEISHTVQALTEHPLKLSVNGNIHDGIEDEDFLKNIVTNELNRRGIENSDDTVNHTGYANIYIYSHQEVDVYALLILKKLKMKGPNRKDFEMILNVLKTFRSKQESRIRASPLQKKYNIEVMDCFIKTRLQYIDQFREESKKI